MLEFLSKNWGSITVLILVIGAAVFAIMKMYSNKKQGKTSCGCGCSSCPSASICHKEKPKDSDAKK